jgi:hypothetical protein
MEFMTGLTGPYPFTGEKYAQVEIKWTGAMEHTTATSISQFLLTGDGRYETLVLHELAHHWFGDSLTPGAWADIWLNEGFARYCEALWVEHTLGSQAYGKFMASIGRERHPELFVGQGLLGDPDPILPNLLVYDKGAWLLHSLRMLMGDDPFFDFLRSYAGDPDLVQGTVRREDMVSAAEIQAGRDLTGFFIPWLQTDAVPEIWWETRRVGGNLQLALHQVQDTLFELAVPVRLDTDCGQVEQVVRLNRRDQLFELDTPCQARSVTVDPDSVVFMFRGQAPPRLLTVRGPAPNPVNNGGGDFEIFLANPSQLIANIYDIRGRRVAKIDIGPAPATGPETDPESVPLAWTLEPETVMPRAPAGIYWVEFKANPGRAIRKMTLIH